MVSQSVTLTPRSENIQRKDPSSYGNHSAIVVTGFHLDATLDFDAKKILGKITLTAVAQKDDPEVLVLDTRDIIIQSITINDEVVSYHLPFAQGPLGEALAIQVPSSMKQGDSVTVVIAYTTNPASKSSAAQWLPAELTSSGKYPYFYTQCQAILCRSIMPCQDSPGVKTPYTASLTVPQGLQAIMSAQLESSTPHDANNTITHHFKQVNPIPSYLFAILVGEIEYIPISDRVGIWTEPAYKDVCQEEFGELERSLKIIESICGPYRWGKYDLVNLVGPFPFGGMENPQITFTSPSLLPLPRETLYKCACSRGSTGKAGLNVCIHEQVHSWSGNLVTNNTWESFFLNEGLTVFIERRTIQILREEEEQQKGYESLHRLIGWEDLINAVQYFEERNESKHSALVLDLSNDVDPDDIYSSIAYEKGFSFMCYLEEVAGGRDVFHAFLKDYFDTFAFKTIDAEGFKNYYTTWTKQYYAINSHINDDISNKLSSIDWELWFHQPGLPCYKPSIDTTLSSAAFSLAEAFVGDMTSLPSSVPPPVEDTQRRLDGMLSNDTFSPNAVHLNNWSPTQLVVFLDRLLRLFETGLSSLSDSSQRSLYQAHWRLIIQHVQTHYYAFHMHGYSEVLFRWLTLQIRSAYSVDTIASSIVNPSDGNTINVTLGQTIEWFLSSIGRMKFVQPLYGDMVRSTTYNEFALDLFERVYKTSYHDICVRGVRNDFKDAQNEPVKY